MNVFFDESGSYKAGRILQEKGESLQVETVAGRRVKIKKRDVFFEFDSPSPDELFASAVLQSQSIDCDFLWDIVEDLEFKVNDLIKVFYTQPSPVEKASLILRIHSAPVYFRRKGRGVYQRAPKDQLLAGLAAIDKKKQKAELQAKYESEIKSGFLPEAIRNQAMSLLTNPDKNSAEFRAVESASSVLGLTPSELMIKHNAIDSVRNLLMARFLSEYFPRGAQLDPVAYFFTPDFLPLSTAKAFSIDDISTTEIDDAFSVHVIDEDILQVGVHIAVPGLGIKRDDAIDKLARERMSTVYMPGEKITMLPEEVIDVFSLNAGGYRPALSLYCLFSRKSFELVSYTTKIERVFIEKNLRLNDLESVVTEKSFDNKDIQFPFKQELAFLWPVAQVLHEGRQLQRLKNGLRREVYYRPDYNFYIDGDIVRIEKRVRDSLLNMIVAELAILANNIWASVLSEHALPAIYRAQRSYGVKRTRMQTYPAPHEGLGVQCYAWMTSPLRRYIDLVNQWQLIALVQHGSTAKLAAPFKAKDIVFYSILQSYEDRSVAYSYHQNWMERYWCLKWLQQEKGGVGACVVGTVIKENTLRLDEVPLQFLQTGVGVDFLGARVLVRIKEINEIECSISCQFEKILDSSVFLDASNVELQ